MTGLSVAGSLRDIRDIVSHLRRRIDTQRLSPSLSYHPSREDRNVTHRWSRSLRSGALAPAVLAENSQYETQAGSDDRALSLLVAEVM